MSFDKEVMESTFDKLIEKNRVNDDLIVDALANIGIVLLGIDDSLKRINENLSEYTKEI